MAATAVAVPWFGVGPALTAAVRALRLAGSAVTALGADNSWVLEPGAGLDWGRRATEHTGFDGLHLDVEFWTLDEYHVDPVACVDGFVTVVQLLRTSLGLPVTVDLPAGLAVENAESFRRSAAAATGVTLLAYRDRADRLLDFSSPARNLLAKANIGYLLGVETQPVSAAIPATLTFGDDGRAVLEHELTVAGARLQADPRFRGWAIHHLQSWADLGP